MTIADPILEPIGEPASCSLPANEQADRIQDIRAGLARQIRERRDLPDGVALAFRNEQELREEIERFVAFERRCCSFARFEIRAPDPEGPLWLDIRGGPAVQTFVDTLFATSADSAEKPLPNDGATTGRIGWGIGGSIASAAALLCCATGVVPFVAAALGIAGASASISLWVDRIAGPAFLVCAGILLHALWRRRARLGSVEVRPAR